ncbi:glycosyltransferase [Ammoniphilus sp. 3BR4]|uniref:glycosyltransferase n=1 Tax=Ammoniphilus sp. 3BR4 TaxID=3158265 RepID=UPI00346597D0
MDISVCIIAKDEENCISDALNSIASIASEIILVDTGSTDRTVDIAAEYGAKIFHTTWENDFSKVRNFALSKAKGEWIVFLDADEKLTWESTFALPSVLKQAVSSSADVVLSLMINRDKKKKVMINSNPTIRIFKNDPKIKYVGKIHEKITREDGELKYTDATNQIIIVHTGYSQDILEVKSKSKRNLDMLFRELDHNPTSSDLCFYISEAYMLGYQLEEALMYAYKVLDFNNSTLYGLKQKNYINIIDCKRALKYPVDDLKATILEAVDAFPTFPDFQFYLGEVFFEARRLHDAIGVFEKGIELIPHANSSQSKAQLEIANKFFVLGRLYYLTNQFHKSTDAFIQSLKVDQYQYASIKNLLSLLSKHENTVDIVNLLWKVYDNSKLKDLVFLFKASLEIRNSELSYYFYNLLSSVQQAYLKKEKLELDFLRGHYSIVVNSFMDIYSETTKEEYILKAIISALLLEDNELLSSIGNKVDDPCINVIPKVLLGKKDELYQESRNHLVTLIKYSMYIKDIRTLPSLLNLVIDESLFIEAAESAFEIENYEASLELFDMYLRQNDEVESDLLAKILLRMGECLYRTSSNWELSLQFFLDALALTPNNYEIYELSLEVCQRLGNKTKTQEIVSKALEFFPDSEYLKSLKNECGRFIVK